VIDGPQELELRIDLAAWLAGVRFEEVAAQAIEGETLRIEPGSQAYEAIIVAMTNVAPPSIEWRER
jgi:hypothetical protein